MAAGNKSGINSATRLFQSICIGLDVKTIRSRSQGIDIDVRDSEGNTPLLFAGIHGKKDIFNLFIDLGANINICNRDECTVLHYASRNGWGKTVRSLVKKGLDLNASDIRGDTPMHYASSSGNSSRHLKVLQYLMKKGADFERNNLAGYTPLLCAAEESNVNVLNLLIYSGAKIDDSNGRLLLYYAVQNRWRCTVRRLLNKVSDLNKICRMDEATFDPSSNKHMELVKLLVGVGTGINPRKEMICRAALRYASCKGHLGVVKWLVNNVPGFRVRDHYGDKPLLAASMNGHLEIVKCLLETGTGVNARQQNGETALHGASKYGHLEIVQCLLEGGLDIEAKNNVDCTALHLASLNGHLEVVKCLVEKGADINAKCILGAVVPLLHAANHDHKDIVALLIDLGANVNISDSFKYTILHLATQNRWSDIVKSVLKRGCEVDVRNYFGDTALVIACEHEQVDIAQALLQAGASWDIENENGKSPFKHLFMRRQPNMSLIKLFIENGAYFKPAGYDLVKRSSLNVLKDAKLCCQAIINKINYYDFPEFYKLLGSGSLPQIAKMKIKSDSEVARTIERTVEFEIQVKGHCDVLEARPIALSVISIRSFLEYCKEKKSDRNIQLKRPAASDFLNNSQHSSKSMRVN